VLAGSDDVDLQRHVLRGMHDALAGRRSAAAPPGWSAVYRKLSASADPEVRQKVLALSLIFGDPVALARLKATAADPRADLGARRAALQALVEKRAPGLVPILHKLLDEKALRGQALRGLAGYAASQTPRLILKLYPALSPVERADAVATLSSRPAYALALLDAVASGRVPRADVSAYTARQLAALNDERVLKRLKEVWGAVRPPAGDKGKLLARYLKLDTKRADVRRGREVFARTCATCHVLFDAGHKIGPDLTGSQRVKAEYVLTKLLDPNAAVAREFQVSRLTTSSGRIITGVVKEESGRTLTVQTANEVVRLAKADVERRTALGVSLMPEGLLATLKDDEVRDLLAYLASPVQVPLPRPGK
jgi:putative heme-binding domain-containing protein